MVVEIYKIIKRCPNYEVSNLGNIRNVETKYIRTPQRNIRGYLWVQLPNNEGGLVTDRIHKFVAEAFLDNPENKKTVNHKNKIRDDNRVENLEWMTMSEQNYHKNIDTKEIRISPHVWRIDKDTNEKLEKYISIQKAVEWLFDNNLTKNKDAGSYISRVVEGKSTINCYGYKWSYDESVKKDLEDEIWKEIPDHLTGGKKNYFVSNLGRYKNKKGQIQELSDKNGYKKLCINYNYYELHRLILLVFSPNKDSDNLVVNHKDGNKLNNKLENLEWVTSQENIQHAYNTGLNSKNCKKIIQYDLNMKEIKRFDTINQASRELNIHSSTINEYLIGAVTSTKYIFKYSSENQNKKTIYNGNSRKIIQYDLKMNELRRFNSINEAIRETQIKKYHIRGSLYDTHVLADFIFRYAE